MPGKLVCNLANAGHPGVNELNGVVAVLVRHHAQLRRYAQRRVLEHTKIIIHNIQCILGTQVGTYICTLKNILLPSHNQFAPQFCSKGN